jgi:pyruvate dehydrogenase complex dehydrogenase (E1) component
VSPDVAVSTNLANWINKRGIYAPADKPNYWTKNEIKSLLKWNETAAGQHIELGIAENNSYLALAMLGLAQELTASCCCPLVRCTIRLWRGVLMRSPMPPIAVPNSSCQHAFRVEF